MTEFKQRWRFLALNTLAIVLVSFAGTIGSLYFLSATPGGERLRQQLGLENLKTFNIETTKTQRIVIEESSAIIEAAKKVQPAVVSVGSKGQAIRDVFGLGIIQAPEAAGTGFIVTSDGLIVTNKHVVAGFDTFTITTFDGKVLDAKVVATDPLNDLALLKVEAKGLSVVDLGDYDRVQVGQWVIAIGNALGEFQNSVTVGVISAKERSASPSDGQGRVENLFGLLQTDAAINPGNSGGPLVNLSGQVIGINTAVAGNAQNIGFALPVSDIKKALESFRKDNKIIQPYIGIRTQTITKAIASTLGLPVEKGALIHGGNQPAIDPNSPAAQVGLKEGDIITKVDNQVIDQENPLSRVVRQHNPGDKITLTILRDKVEQKIDVVLGSL
ncbi:MAG: trypsin-like peptidase domain-containing protein [Patescibacteria group bacterium]